MNVEKLYLNRAQFVMKLLGIWMLSEGCFVYKVYGVFMIAIQYLFLIFQAVYIVQVWGDLEAVSQASYLLFTQACLCFKVTVFLVNTHRLKQLLKIMNDDIFKPQSVQHEKILRRQAFRIKRMLLGFMLSSQITCALWALKPLMDDVGSRSFPFDMWMPVKADLSPQYELGYLFQFVTISISAYLYFAVDSVALSLVVFACAQLDIVKDKVLSVKAPKGKMCPKGEMTKNYKKLIECAIHHQEIVSLAALIEDTYHTYLLFQLSGSIGLICMSALRIIVVKWMSMQMVSIAVYLAVMISQLYVCCWCGHELTATSASLHQVLYTCAWQEQDARFARALLFIMARAGRPIVLRAGHYVVLSRQTFVAILRMSYSYFAVLKQTKHDHVQ